MTIEEVICKAIPINFGWISCQQRRKIETERAEQRRVELKQNIIVIVAMISEKEKIVHY